LAENTLLTFHTIKKTSKRAIKPHLNGQIERGRGRGKEREREEREREEENHERKTLDNIWHR
jgi:hypothetical protein